MSKATRRLTDAQKYSRDLDAILSGSPVRVARRVKNRIVGRALRGVFRQIFR